ncbi:hypothetical protein FQN60_009939 [Etheostoma spectabile]|uniref:Uncharacterized protein n=1 Tax=Etheostoma spectabile TaxID=54343 RepID=A0A5J5D5C3_9PERO|nr:hypothetical protein FQN60_009939 [Etheostoma spectabile]
METTLSKLGIRVLKVFCPSNEQESQGSEAVFNLPLNGKVDPVCTSSPELSFYERNSSLCTVEGPSQQIKNSKYKHAPIRELAANQPLPQRICVICKAASVYV